MIKIIFTTFLTLLALHSTAQESAKESANLLNGMLQDSAMYTDEYLKNRAIEIAEKFPGTKEAEFAQYVVRMIDYTLQPASQKEVTPTLDILELISEDPITDVKHYKHRYGPHAFDGMSIQMRSKKGKPDFFLTLGYTGQDWIFFDQFEARCGEKVYQLTFPYKSVFRDTGRNSVYESIDIPLTGKAKEIATCIAQNPAKKIIRLSGKRLKTTELPLSSVFAIREMLDLQKNWGRIKKSSKN